MKRRVDIQVLRGIAVLLVMAYHADFSIIAKGYLGVDIFFVLSGFLISRIVLQDLQTQQFSFKQFYLRRALRLLPAAYVVFLSTSLLASLFLSMPALWTFLMQLVSSLTFTGNIFFWLHSDYFSNASDLMPLLHIWSLSVEEQFYFFLPLLLFVLPNPLRRLMLPGLALASFAWYCYLVVIEPSAAFYLLPARAWELLLGSVLATALIPDVSNFRYKEILSLILVMLLVWVVVTGFDNVLPQFDALLACGSVVLLLAFNAKVLNEGVHSRFLAKVGNISYSLYLVHWPLIAIAKNIYIDQVVPQWLYMVLFLVSFPLAFLLYHYIEKPFRQGNNMFRIKLPYLLCISVMLMMILPILSIYIANYRGHEDWNYIRRVNFGLSPVCEYGEKFEYREQCATAEKHDVLVWGDSYAMHLVPGLLKIQPEIHFAQATRSSCVPNLFIAQVNHVENARWASSCLAFNQSVVEYIKKRNIRYVILAARFDSLQGDVLSSQKIISMNMRDIAKTFVDTIEIVRQAGAYPILVAPPPVNGAEIGECLEKQSTGVFYMSKKLDRDCRITLDTMQAYHQYPRELLGTIELLTDVRVVRPSDVLCNKTGCDVNIEGVPLYRDDGHYSVAGSEVLLPKLNIFNSHP